MRFRSKQMLSLLLAAMLATGSVGYTVQAEDTQGTGQSVVKAEVQENVLVDISEQKKISVELKDKDAKYVYSGKAFKPEVVVTDNRGDVPVTWEEKDYNIEYDNRTDVGESVIKVKATKDGFTGTKEVSFKIEPLDIAEAASITAEWKNPDEKYLYNGKAFEPEVVVKEKQGTEEKEWKLDTDYTIEYANNVEAGTATATIKPKNGNYTGERKLTFTIETETKVDISEQKKISVELKDKDAKYIYSGKAFKPEVVVTDNRGATPIKWDEKDYKVEYDNRTDVGKSVIKVTAEKGGFTGTKEISFTIDPLDITNEASITAEWKKPNEKYVYTGKRIEPEVVMKEKAEGETKEKIWVFNTDYAVEFIHNIDAGTNTATATIKPKSANYTGEKKLTFTIEPKDINDPDVELQGKDKDYKGRELNSDVVMKYNGMELERSKDYTVGDYKNNVNVGKATGVVTGKGNFKGTRNMEFNIFPKNIAEVNFSSVSSRFFDKTYHEPEVKVSMDIEKDNKIIGREVLKKEKDYTISYMDNKKVGTAGIMIVGKGNYGGSKIITFKIRPQSTRLLKLERGKRRIRATWEKRTKQVTGYILQFSPKKNFSSSVKKVTLKKRKTNKLVKGLRSKKRYYVRVRTYKNVNGIKYYSKWSNKMSIKTR
ncbi:MAG: fibronectin type III domain-containing protein [Eubacteriales bacterium]|nr:fibronectin type III domain-containing protein [Eubacteriales bacterium]